MTTATALARWAALHPWPRPSDPPPPVTDRRLRRDLADTRRHPVGRWAWLAVAVGLHLTLLPLRWAPQVPAGWLRQAIR